MFSIAASTITFLLALLIGFSFDEFRPDALAMVEGVASFVSIDLFFLSRRWERPNYQIIRGITQASLVLGLLWAPGLRAPVSHVLAIAALIIVGSFVAQQGAWLWRRHCRR